MFSDLRWPEFTLPILRSARFRGANERVPLLLRSVPSVNRFSESAGKGPYTQRDDRHGKN